MLPTFYNNNYQLVQTRDYVAILTEMIHDVRVIPLDGRPHGNVRQWMGDSRGHWEGDTLVFEPIHFHVKRVWFGTPSPESAGPDRLHVKVDLFERFTRT